jgi:hypothetical protein
MDMDRVKKVAVLHNEVEAKLVDRLLSDEGIPHLMRSYHDSAYDGLFQGGGVWGHIEAPLEFHEQIKSVIDDVRRQARSSDTESAGGEEDET